MNNLKTKIRIICPLVDEYDACKEILSLKNESEILGCVISEGKEDYEYNPSSGKDLGEKYSGEDDSFKVIIETFYKKTFQEFSNSIDKQWPLESELIMWPVVKRMLKIGN